MLFRSAMIYVIQVCWYMSYRFVGICHTGLLVYVIQVCWYMSYRFGGICHTGLLVYVTQVCWYMSHRFAVICHTGLVVYVTQVCWYMSHRFAGICHTGLVIYVIQVCCKLASYQQTCMTYTIAVCALKKTPDDGQRNCLKHAEFYSKNKFKKLVHLVGFIIRIYHDARSTECL